MLRTEEATNFSAIFTFVPNSLETHCRSVPVVPQVLQSSIDQEQKSDVLDQLSEAPAMRTIYPLRRLGSVNQMETTLGTSRSEMTTMSREEQLPDQFFDVVRAYIFPWHVYKQYFMNLNLQMSSVAADEIRVLNGAKLFVNGLYSIEGANCLIAEEISSARQPP